MPNKPSFLKQINRKTLIKIFAITFVLFAISTYLVWDIVVGGPLKHFLTNRDELIAAVESWGIFAPLLYILLNTIQIVVAPIPGQVVGSIGGYIFGPWGILWSSISTVLGSYIVFRLARRFGRPLIEKIFKKSAVDKFDFILSSNSSAFAIFLIFLLPGFPDDMVCYLAGLTPIPIRKLVLLMLIGRFPTIVVTNFVGAGLTTNLPMVIIVSVISLAVLGIVVWQRERIIKLLDKNRAHKDTPKKEKK